LSRFFLVSRERHFVYLRSLQARWLLASFCLAALAAEPGGWRIVDGDIAVPPGGREAAFGAKLWPSGRIPYEIAAGYKSRECLDKAVGEWNRRTVIKLAPRAGETDYLVFTPSPRSFTVVGLMRGPQPVFLEEGECGWGLYRTIVHEIGHSVGLFHEHQRSDRDRFIVVHPEFSNLTAQDLTVTQGSPTGPYDFASVMHYGPLGGAAGAVIETIPRGIPTSLDQGIEPMLSAGDLDAVSTYLRRAFAPHHDFDESSGARSDGGRAKTRGALHRGLDRGHAAHDRGSVAANARRSTVRVWTLERRRAAGTHDYAGVLTHFAANFVTYVRIRA
jgi:hypothetical protein